MSLVLATDYRVRDFDVWWDLLSRETAAMARLSAHHVVVYRSIDDRNRVFMTIGVRERGSLDALMQSSRVFEWFDAAGVEDFPPVFAGTIVEKIDLHEDHDAIGPAGVILASIAPLQSLDTLHEAVHTSLERMRHAGVLRYWLYRALDNADEAMIIREIATEQQAGEWLKRPEMWASFRADAGSGAYPPPFVGTLVETITLPTADGR